MLKELFGAPWWVVLALGIYGLCWGVFHDLHSQKTSRTKWIKLLRESHWLRTYRGQLAAALDWLDARLSPEVDGDPPSNGWGWTANSAKAAWSAQTMKYAMALALAYGRTRMGIGGCIWDCSRP